METILQTDVVVLGGGSAGVAAAVAAARSGSQVTLIERNAFLGGKATAAEVGTVCGLYKFTKEENAEYLVKGFAEEFAEKLRKRSNTNPLHNSDGLHYLPYKIDVFKKLAEELLAENNINILYNTVLKTVQVADGKISSISVIAAGNPVTLQLKSIIDCSGESIVSRLAGIPVIKSEQYQAAAQVFTLRNVDEDNEARLGMILMKALHKAIDEDVLADFYDRSARSAVVISPHSAC